jgi:anti-sigma B factor antagonist
MQQILKNLYLTPVSTTGFSDAAPFEADHRGHAVRLSVAGELDIATMDSLSNVAIGALRLPVRVLILDLYEVTFCGAAGVNALIKILQAASDAGTRLVLTGLQPPVRQVLDLVGLTAMIPLLATPKASPAGTDRLALSQTSDIPVRAIELEDSRPLQAA